jgi:hypothetical protein
VVEHSAHHPTSKGSNPFSNTEREREREREREIERERKWQRVNVVI